MMPGRRPGGDHIYDGRRPEDFSACITFGPSDYTPEDAECLVGGIESPQIDLGARSEAAAGAGAGGRGQGGAA